MATLPVSALQNQRLSVRITPDCTKWNPLTRWMTAGQTDRHSPQCAHYAHGEGIGIGKSLKSWHAWWGSRILHRPATLLSELRESIKTAQAQLGHSSLQTTLEICTHAVPETQRAAVERLEHLLLGGQLDPNGSKSPVLEEAGSGRVQ